MKTFLRKRIKDTLSFTDAWRELEDIMLNEISQIQNNKYHMFSLKCGTLKRAFARGHTQSPLREGQCSAAKTHPKPLLGPV